MNIPRTFSGIVLALFITGTAPALAATIGASELTLYMRLKTIAEKQVLGDMEPDIAQYVQSLVQSQYDTTLALDDISVAARAGRIPGALRHPGNPGEYMRRPGTADPPPGGT